MNPPKNRLLLALIPIAVTVLIGLALSTEPPSPACTAGAGCNSVWTLRVPLSGGKERRREFKVGVRQMKASSQQPYHVLEVVSSTWGKFYSGVFGLRLPNGVNASALAASWELDPSTEQPIAVIKAPLLDSSSHPTTKGKLDGTEINFSGVIADYHQRPEKDPVKALSYYTQSYNSKGGMLVTSTVAELDSVFKDVDAVFTGVGIDKPVRWLHEKLLVTAVQAEWEVGTAVGGAKKQAGGNVGEEWDVQVEVKHFTEDDYESALGLWSPNPYSRVGDEDGGW